jgi:hypothetical protein
MDFDTECDNLNSFDQNRLLSTVPAKDKLRLFAIVLGILPYELTCFQLRRILWTSPLSWKEDLKRVIGRL